MELNSAGKKSLPHQTEMRLLRALSAEIHTTGFKSFSVLDGIANQRVRRRFMYSEVISSLT
jgi:hypothetical protein